MSKAKKKNKVSRKEMEQDEEDVSTLRPSSDPIVAIACSDLHLSHRPPIARSEEKDWYGCMEEALGMLDLIAEENGVPILYAGDIFDHWDQPPELLSFAIQKLPAGFSIPGQHDLPNHSYDNIERSAYWTLVEAGVLQDIYAETQVVHKLPLTNPHVRVFGYPWGFNIEPCEAPSKSYTNIALCHKYVWWDKSKFKDAPKEDRADMRADSREGYHTVVYGDNHKGFLLRFGEEGEPVIFNCGTFMRRKIDEVGYKPQVGLIHKSGRVTPHYLQYENEVFLDGDDIEELVEKAFEGAELLEELARLGKFSVDFGEVLLKVCRKNEVAKKVISVILSALDGTDTN